MKSTADCKNLFECALHWETTTPDRVWLTQPMGGGDLNIKTWTWAEAVGEARRMASYLKSLDFPKRSNIAICSKNCAYWLIADLAIWMAGHTSVPVYPTLTADVVAYILEHSEAKLLFVGKLDPIWSEMKNGVPGGMRMVAFPLAPGNDYGQWSDIVNSHEPLMETPNFSSDETATIIYTSGSTGRPKGAMISFGAMYRGAKGICEFGEANSSDRGLSYLPLAHVYDRVGTEACSLYVGSQVFFAETLDTFIIDLKRARPTIFLSVPRLWLKFQLGVFEKIPPEKLDTLLRIPILNLLVKRKILKQLGLDQVRIAVSASAPIPKEVIEWYRCLGLELLEVYGMTENFAYSHGNALDSVRPGYVGKPYDGVEQKLSENNEILVKSPCNMKGYYKMPETNDNIFTEDGFLRTGDLGELDEMGRLKIIGRVKELFKTSKGEYVAPAPIENLLSNNPLVEASYVTGEGLHQPHGIVLLSEEAKRLVSDNIASSVEKRMLELLADVNRTLPKFEQLAFIVVTKDDWSAENGFLTPTLKIKRKVLEKKYSPLAEKWYAMNKQIIWQTAQ
jgi:long-subunit acyl-CoA synthetase (AMP-forming)